MAVFAVACLWLLVTEEAGEAAAAASAVLHSSSCESQGPLLLEEGRLCVEAEGVWLQFGAAAARLG